MSTWVALEDDRSGLGRRLTWVGTFYIVLIVIVIGGMIIFNFTEWLGLKGSFWMMISKILVVADLSMDALELVLGVLQKIQKRQPSIKVIFVSFLSEISLKNLGPNILVLLSKEENETIEEAEEYFTRADIPHQIKLIAAPHWEAILDEMRRSDQDLVILQGEFLRILREDELDPKLYSQANFEPRCPILMIDEPETTAFSRAFHSVIS